jgi:hypothetical protein
MANVNMRMAIWFRNSIPKQAQYIRQWQNVRQRQSGKEFADDLICASKHLKAAA